ncbi:MAG: hypothetical protein IKO36_12715 [Bacteroidaceae bacterium]|nr:hypothetical protein [Bacteroidaceae bacterium]
MKNTRKFCQSINEFPVKTTEDEQNERLRKIHTFQASFDDFISYINQRIEDTKYDENENNVIKENMNILDFENFVINESVKEWNLVTENVQSSIIRNLLTAVDTSDNTNFTSFISLFKNRSIAQLAWDQIQDTDFETFIVHGKYPINISYGEKFNTRNIAEEDKKMVSALKKAIKNNGLSIYLKDDIVKAISFGTFWYTFGTTIETNHEDPVFMAAKKAKYDYADSYHEREHNGVIVYEDPEYIKLSTEYEKARKAAEREVNIWRNKKQEDLTDGIWAQILVYWGVNKICILQNTQKYNIQNIQNERRLSKQGIVDLSPEGLAKLAKANMERYKKIVSEKKANSDAAFAKQDQEFMDTIMEGMKTIAEIRTQRAKILEKGSWISRAADCLDTMMSYYERYIQESNRYVETLARYQEKGREYTEDWNTERRDMEKYIKGFKETKVEFDGYIERIKAD